jgi:acyl-CoA thioester hydrolase
VANEVFTSLHRVTYAWCTMGDHVYYGRYLDILEAARGEFFRHLGSTFLQWQGAGFAFPVIECRFRCKIPAHYDDLLSVDLWVDRVDRLHIEFGYRILKHDRQVVLEASTHHVGSGLDGRPRRLPVHLVESLQPYIRAVLPVEA